jgi:signal transduction histidine kinase
MPVKADDNEFCGFGALSRLMNMGILVLDRDAALEFANPLAVELLGGGSAGELKRRWGELGPQLGLRADRLRDRPDPHRLTAELRTDGRTRSLRLEVYSLEEEACTGYLVLLKDRRAVDVLEMDLLLASQMRSVPHLYRVLAHDLKAPLNAMQLTVELLADSQSAASDPAREAKRQRYISVLKEEMRRLDRILQTMLGENEPIGSASRTFDFRDVVREIAALLTPQARRERVSLELDLPEQPVEVTGMRDRLKQAFLNIAINGLEAMPAGGRLALRLAREGENVVAQCRDTGPGIAPESLDEIYQLYYTTKKTGSGIGLYVARLVAESHGGEIRVESRPGQGTSVTLLVPLRAPAR